LYRYRWDCEYFGVPNTKQNDFPDFKSSVTEAFIGKGEDIFSKQMQIIFGIEIWGSTARRR